MKQQHLLLPLLACVVTLAFSATCFRPSIKCAPCAGDWCSGGLKCDRKYGLCVDNSAEKECTGSIDASTSSDAVAESTPDTTTEDVSSTTDTTSTPDNGGAAECVDRCCIGAAACLDLPPRLRQGLLLWADRTSMGQPGSPLERWSDRSGKGHHIQPLNSITPPLIKVDAVGPIAEIDQSQMAMATPANASLRLGLDDFAILVLARCDADAQQAILLQKRGATRPRTGVAMFCNHNGAPLLQSGQTSDTRAFLTITDEDQIPLDTDGMIASQRNDFSNKFHLFTARRVDGNRLQLRVDGSIEGERTIRASANLSDDLPFFVASVATPAQPYITNFRGGLAAVVIVRGPLTDTELADLESFLMRTAGEGAPRL